MKADFEVRKRMEGINPCVASVSRKINKSSDKKKHCSSSPSTDNDKDKAEIKAYLNKLQELVPFMPKNKKLSKVEVISYVIEYIRELRVTLGLPPCNSSAYPNMDMIMDHSSPALMMTMTMMTRPGQCELSSSDNLTTSISDAAPVSPVIAAAAPIQKTCINSSSSSCRQPLGVILNPTNCANGSLTAPATTLSHQVFPNCTSSCTIPSEK